MIKKYTFFILPFFLTLVVLQSCWKDESLKDKTIEDININIVPSFGIPLANLTLTGGDIVKQLDMSDSSKSFYIEYDNEGLCVVVYDKTNLRITLPSALPFDTVVTFPIDYFSDLQIDGMEVKQAFINLNIENGYTEDIRFQIKKLTYKDEFGNENQVVSSGLESTNVIKAAKANGQPTHTQLFHNFLTINDPFDIVNHGTNFLFGFNLNYNQLGSSGSLELNPVVKVPAWFSVESFSRMDTVVANLENLGDIFSDETVAVKTATLYLTINNGLPLETNLQVYFADENYKLIDSLQTKELQIPSGEISSYKLVKPTPASFEITMSEERSKKIEKSRYIIFKENFRTYDGRDVKLFRSNTLGVILSVKATAEINGSISEITK